jgi:hypothetical protein
MNDFAHSMEVVKAYQDLFAHPPHQRNWDSFIVIAFHDLEQVDSQNLKNHDEMVTIGSVVHKRVEQLYHLGVQTSEFSVQFSAIILLSFVVVSQTFQPFRILHVLGDDIQNLNFIVSCYLVAWCTLLHLESYVGVLVKHILCKPDSRELAPSQLLNDHIAPNQYFSKMHGMVSTHLVFFDAFIFAVLL